MKKKKDVDTKINELAQTIAGGFAEMQKELRGVHKEVRGVRSELSEIHDELKGDIANLQTEMKEDITNLRDELRGDIQFLRGDIDIMLDKHIGTFRKDYDDLAMRVKKLERRVFAH